MLLSLLNFVWKDASKWLQRMGPQTMHKINAKQDLEVEVSLGLFALHSCSIEEIETLKYA